MKHEIEEIIILNCKFEKLVDEIISIASMSYYLILLCVII